MEKNPIKSNPIGCYTFTILQCLKYSTETWNVEEKCQGKAKEQNDKMNNRDRDDGKHFIYHIRDLLKC